MNNNIERECRFEWIEAAIRWHQKQVALHQDAEYVLNRMHTELCRASSAWRTASAAGRIAAGGPAPLAPGRFLPDLAGASAPAIFSETLRPGQAGTVPAGHDVPSPHYLHLAAAPRSSSTTRR
jgi:hypothetical protein